MTIETICIIGLGLIGGSLAKALKEKAGVQTIYAVDPNPLMLDKAIEEGAIDGKLDPDSPLLRKADLIFVCTPVDQVTKTVEKLASLVKKDCIIVDTASTKGKIIAEIEDISGEFCFVGGHPMAGSEKNGYEASRAHLFENAYFVLTPCSKSSREAVSFLTEITGLIGAIPLEMTPDLHDNAVGLISHLPHIVAASLVNLLTELDGQDGLCEKLAAGGFRDITRIASSDPNLWSGITKSNSEAISELIDRFIHQLGDLKAVLQNETELAEYYKNAKTTRDRLSERLNSLIPQVYDLYVDVEDKPGMISAVATALGDRNINIKNINIANNREETGGVMVVTLENEAKRREALDVLSQKGFKAIIRSKE